MIKPKFVGPGLQVNRLVIPLSVYSTSGQLAIFVSHEGYCLVHVV